MVCIGGGAGRIMLGGSRDMESDRQFYTRRVTSERLAAARAVTVEARERRLLLVQSYLEKLRAMPA